MHLIMYKHRRNNISSIKDIPRTLEKYLWSILICAICTIFPIRFIIHILFHTIAYSVSISNIQYPLSHIQSTAHIFIPHSMYFISHLIPPHTMFLTHIPRLISHIPSFNSISRTSHSLSHISYRTSSISGP